MNDEGNCPVNKWEGKGPVIIIIIGHHSLESDSILLLSQKLLNMQVCVCTYMGNQRLFDLMEEMILFITDDLITLRSIYSDLLLLSAR